MICSKIITLRSSAGQAYWACSHDLSEQNTTRIRVSSINFNLLSFLLESFWHQRQLMAFHWSLSDYKSPQASRTLLSILADPNKAVVCIVSTRPIISKFSWHFTNPLAIVPKAPNTISINITFMFHSFFNYLPRSRYLSFFSLSYNSTLWSASTAKSTIFCWLLCGLVVWPRLSNPFAC